MIISLIAAMDRDRIIGSADGGIPWHLPRDAEHFRSCTAGKHMLLGRKTYEEMKGWFQRGQVPVILTHQPDYQPDEGFTAASVDASNGVENFSHSVA